ncbi:MAG: Fis family transcriptional regulator [Myxococcales bacterium]|nr:Fis family transcriptional regulator [Myxococcales bacterium]
MSENAITRGATVVVGSAGTLAVTRPTFKLVPRVGPPEVFDQWKVRIGSGPGNDWVLKDNTVSATHAEITVTDKGFRIKDTGSTNGTFIDGIRVMDAILAPGKKVSFGNFETEFHVLEDTVSEKIFESEEYHGAVGRSAHMRTLFSRIQKVATTPATVLIQGETGTGKEVVAWAIYEASNRKDENFVVIDCSAIPKNLIESELFGHEKGAFTGAVSQRKGAFERAHGGTLFLDELGELELELQPKLLRALEQRKIQRVGGDKPIDVDVRIIAATNRDLQRHVAQGSFREDLYYRLAVVNLDLPPLRERLEDLDVLVNHFLHQMGKAAEDLPEGSMDIFRQHTWPGNCRELRNAVERAVVLGEAVPQPTPRQSAASSAESGPQTVVHNIDMQTAYKAQKAEVIADFEEKYARLLLKAHQGNVSAAARQAGIDRMSLHKILSRYDLDPHQLARG